MGKTPYLDRKILLAGLFMAKKILIHRTLKNSCKQLNLINNLTKVWPIARSLCACNVDSESNKESLPKASFITCSSSIIHWSLFMMLLAMAAHKT